MYRPPTEEELDQMTESERRMFEPIVLTEEAA